MTKLSAFLFVAAGPLAAQPLINGPMTGPPDLMEVTVWAQCPGGCSAAITYWPSLDPAKRTTTRTFTSDADRAHAMDFRLGPLLPGTEYRYVLHSTTGAEERHDTLSFRTQTLWKFRTDPPPFKVALGSCTYINEAAYDRPGRAYGDTYGIFNSIADQKPDLMLWLGDNVYLREPDWGSWSGFMHRYTHTRSTPELQRLLRSTAHAAIWDDHDFGPNDGDGSFVGSDMARKAFDLFWPNPSNSVPGVEGTTSMFSYYDVDFFLMDDRTFRVAADMRTSEPAVLGNAQLDWLIRALKYSDASFKCVAVGGQVLNTSAVYENYSTVPKEREELLRRIEEEGIKGVVFLTGDRHFTELSALKLKDGRTIYDLTTSPLTSGPYAPKEENTLRVEGTVVAQRNFSTIEVSGAKGARTMTVRVFDATGKPLWDRIIAQDQ
ncbi:MAG: alkaline phosphatase family protein [Flavobacteriales bacterium]|nr:alkaline phosphatase family protein [Flavobacteriales bacterium]